jgi:hypothetical protein
MRLAKAEIRSDSIRALKDINRLAAEIKALAEQMIEQATIQANREQEEDDERRNKR